MAQVGVADEDKGQPLAIGQRLVTRDGRMRRWDGFIAEAGGATAAERLIRVNRLAEIERALPSLENTVVKAASARDQAAAAVEQFRQGRCGATAPRRRTRGQGGGTGGRRRRPSARTAGQRRPRRAAGGPFPSPPARIGGGRSGGARRAS
jgi:chromosome segregation protein